MNQSPKPINHIEAARVWRAQIEGRTTESSSGCLEFRSDFEDCSGAAYVNHEGERWRAHRISYAFHVDDVGEGLDVVHTCGNNRCVKPRHLKTRPTIHKS